MKHIKLYESFTEDLIEINNRHHIELSNFIKTNRSRLEDCLLGLKDAGYDIGVTLESKTWYCIAQIKNFNDSDLIELIPLLKHTFEKIEIEMDSKVIEYEFSFRHGSKAGSTFSSKYTTNLIDHMSPELLKSKGYNDVYKTLNVIFHVS